MQNARNNFNMDLSDLRLGCNSIAPLAFHFVLRSWELILILPHVPYPGVLGVRHISGLQASSSSAVWQRLHLKARSLHSSRPRGGLERRQP